MSGRPFPKAGKVMMERSSGSLVLIWLKNSSRNVGIGVTKWYGVDWKFGIARRSAIFNEEGDIKPSIFRETHILEHDQVELFSLDFLQDVWY